MVKEPSFNDKKRISEEPLVRIATAPNEPTALMWQEMLDNEGIRCLLKSKDLSAAMYTPSLISRFEIYVLESQAEKAKIIISPFLQE